MRKPLVGIAVCAATIVGFGGSAFAGEWGGNGELIVVNGKSVCAFSGLDESDETEIHTDPPSDDGMWGSTPAKGRVQSPGQINALSRTAAAIPARDGCNPNNPEG